MNRVICDSRINIETYVFGLFEQNRAKDQKGMINKMENHEINLSLDIIIPTYKPGEKFDKLLKRLTSQTKRPNHIYIINTEEKYLETSRYERYMQEGIDYITVIHIKKEEFDHGGTRNYGASLSKSDIVMFMTDDAVPADEYLIENILKAFRHEGVAACYGRQLANKNASMLEKYTRVFNYPDEDIVKSKKDLERLGIKTYFCSNVCAAYRNDIYQSLGGFVTKTIFNEDMIMASKIISAGYNIYYASKAKVIHSHKYTYRQQFTRNFDLAVSQKQYKEIFENVKSETEGIRLVKKSMSYLANKKKFYLIPDLIVQSGFKYLGYKMGYNYDKLPKNLVIKCSMNKSYWEKN